MKINIAFDARMITHSGIGRYIREILRKLTDMDGFNFTIFGDVEKLTDYKGNKVQADFSIYSIREQILFPRLLKQNRSDLLHVPHYNAPLGYKGTTVVTVHDLIHLHYPPSYVAYCYAKTMLSLSCRKAKMIIVISENTKKDLVKMLAIDPDKIRVIYPGVGEEFCPSPNPEDRLSTPNKAGYILHVGNIKPTKNIKMIIDAFLLALKDIPDAHLVLIGKNSMRGYTKKLDKHPNIQFLGEMKHKGLVNLYRDAKIFVFPSLYEGFGLPPLEAMACGLPVICSNVSSLPEVVGDAAIMIDPNKVNELSQAIIRLWKDDAKRREYSEKGLARAKMFTWAKCADETAEVYRECLS